MSVSESEIIHEVVTAIATVKGVEPDELDIVLADHVDPELLRKVVSAESGACKLTFQVPNHEVTVTETGTVFVDRLTVDCTAEMVD